MKAGAHTPAFFYLLGSSGGKTFWSFFIGGSMQFLSLLILSALAQAGGTISREEAIAAVCAKSRAMCSQVKHLHLVRTGTAVRDHEGYRLMPFNFNAVAPDGEAMTVQISESETDQIVLTIQ